MNPIKALQDWFTDLDEDDQKLVLSFLYGKLLLTEGTYCGPVPGMVKTGGLYCGPAPATQRNRCPTCGRPL